MKKKKFLSVLATATVFSSILASSVYADTSKEFQAQMTTSDVHNLSTTPPGAGVSTQGENPPPSGASVHDLSISPYNYQVTEVGAQVFTDKFPKGKTSMQISVKDWKYSGEAVPNDSLVLTVFTKSGEVKLQKTLTGITSSTSYTFTGLTSTSEYYVRFAVPRNDNKYSFNGSIS